MKLYKLLSILNFIDNNIEITVKDKKNNIFYKSSGELDLVYLFKKLGGYKVNKVNFYTKSNSLVIFVKSDTKKKQERPTTKEELIEIINQTIEKEGYNCNLNFIDTCLITDMNGLFYESKFNGDISKWDVSNVEDMNGMFYCSSFNGDISNWNVSNVEDMSYMFSGSDFDGDISKWNILKVKFWKHIFDLSPLNTNPPKWFKAFINS